MNPKVNIEQFFVSDNTCSWRGYTWDAGTLFAAARDLEPYDLQLSALDLDRRFVDASTLSLFLYQMKRVRDADLNYPIIQAPDGWIMDGLHRVAKAILEGHTTIKAVKLPVLPKPDRVDEK
jgi:hypothetical protein